MSNLVVFAIAIGQIGFGSGRFVPTAAAVVGLVGVILGGMSLAGGAGRGGAMAAGVAGLISLAGGAGRGGAMAAGVAGLISLVVGGLHAANSAGGFGTGNGLAGAIAAILLGLIGILLAAVAVIRARQRERDPSQEG